MNYELPKFDTLLELAKEDPSTLDRVKKEAIQALLCNAPKHSQRRLRGLQFQIDMELRRSKSSMDGCIKISKMMHESLDSLRRNLRELVESREEVGLNSVDTQPRSAKTEVGKPSADILPFESVS